MSVCLSHVSLTPLCVCICIYVCIYVPVCLYSQSCLLHLNTGKQKRVKGAKGQREQSTRGDDMTLEDQYHVAKSKT